MLAGCHRREHAAPLYAPRRGHAVVSEKTERPPLSLVTETSEGEEVGEFPRTFGNYLLLSPLGQGGMGDVYLAKIGGIAGIEKHCVLKTLRPQFPDDREY